MLSVDEADMELFSICPYFVVTLLDYKLSPEYNVATSLGYKSSPKYNVWQAEVSIVKLHIT